MMIFLAELNGLVLWATGIGNAYLKVYTSEKVASVAGLELTELQGHTLIVSRTLYGLHLSGKYYYSHSLWDTEGGTKYQSLVKQFHGQYC